MISPTVATYKPIITGSTTATIGGEVRSDGTEPTHVQSTQTGNAASGNAINVAYSSNVTAGNLLVVATGINTTTATVTVSDTQVNSWSQASIATESTIPYRIYVHYAIANATGANTVTMTPSTSVAGRRLAIHEYSGVDTLSNASSNTKSTGIPDSGATTISAAGLLFGWGINNTGTTVADPGFNLRQTCLSESTVDRFITAPSNYNVTYPTDPTAWACIAATFIEASVVTERGIVWNTTGSPTTADNKVTNSSGMGYFTNDLTGLTDGTTYYARAYAINSNGTSYGNEVTFRNMKASTAWLKG